MARRQACGRKGVSRDGSPVQVYRALPSLGEPELIHAALPRSSSVLDLGCGTGRTAAPLVRLGHHVTGVDESPEMLATLDAGVEGVLGDARTVRLGRRFDAVLLASHLLNDTHASPLLETAVAHLASGGSVLAEVYPPAMDWDAAIGRTSSVGPVEVTVVRASLDDRMVDALVRYRLGARAWEQAFVARMLDESEIRELLGAHGLVFGCWLDAARGWFIASLAER